MSASGTKPRPAYQRLLADLAEGRADAVVVWDLDRLTRRPIEIEAFIDLTDRHSIALASVGGDVDLASDNGRMFARIKGAVGRAKLATVRFGSARYSVPARLVGATVAVSAVDQQIIIRRAGEEVARQALVPPGGVALNDAHYDRPARRPSRAVRARTAQEKAFLALGSDRATSTPARA